MYDMKSSSCIKGSLSLCNIMRLNVKGRFPVNCYQMNRFLGKAAVLILCEFLQLPPNNEFVTEE